MVDFDKDRDANLAAFELTGGCASNGLTVRDYFAAMAMQALIHHYDFDRFKQDPWRVAEYSYEMSDRMMNKRNGTSSNRPEPCSVEEAFGL